MKPSLAGEVERTDPSSAGSEQPAAARRSGGRRVSAPGAFLCRQLPGWQGGLAAGWGSRGSTASRGVGCQPAPHSWDVSVGPILSSALGQAPARCIPTALPVALLLAVPTLPLVSGSCPMAQSTRRVSPGEAWLRHS